MRETTKTPRAHAELAARFMADSSVKCWWWSADAARWAEIVHPNWRENLIYHVSHEAPTEPPKRQVIIAGIEFDAPETEAPIAYSEYWTFIAGSQSVWKVAWEDSERDFKRLHNGFVHTTQEAAELHSEALTKLNRQLCFGDENTA